MQPQMVVALRIVNSDKMSPVQMYVFYELKGSVKDLNMFHNYETEKITCDRKPAIISSC